MLFSVRKIFVWIVLVLLFLFLFGFMEMFHSREECSRKTLLPCFMTSVFPAASSPQSKSLSFITGCGFHPYEWSQ